MDAFLRGTLVLALTAFVSECIEFLINLVLAKELGELGIGQYMSILPVVGLFMIIASLELPISISKFVAETERRFHFSLLRTAFKLVMLFMVVLFLLATILFSFFPLFHDVHPLVRWVILILIPLVSITSIGRGYFIGIQRMGTIAVANLFRRITQLFILVLVFQFFQFDLQLSLLVAICAVIGGELLEFTYVISAFFVHLRHLRGLSNSENLDRHTVLKNLLTVSLPTTSMRIFHAVTHAIQPFLIKLSLVFAGLSKMEATEHFGMVAGVAMTIGFFPAFIAHSLMTVLIPNVSKAYAVNDKKSLLLLLRRVIVITASYGIPVCFVFYFFAEPLTNLFVPSKAAAYYLQLLWPYFLLHYFTIPFQAFLIGMGLVKDAFYHNIWSHLIAFVLIFSLGSQPSFQMDGVILGLNTGAVLAMFMHYLTICKKLGISITLSSSKNIQY